MQKILFAILLLTLSCYNLNNVRDNAISIGKTNPFLYGFNETIPFNDLKQGDIPEATNAVIIDADEILKQIIDLANDARTFDNTMVRIDDIFNIIEKVWSPGYLMGSTHPNQAIREEGLESSRKIQKYVTDLSLNEDLYNAVLSFSNSKKSQNLSGYKKKFLNDTLLDYKRRGFGLSKEKRDMVKGILNKLSDLGIEFSKNISDFQDTLFVTEDEINGLPENYKMERKMIDGTFAIDMSYPSYVPFMDFSISDEAREKLRYKFTKLFSNRRKTLESACGVCSKCIKY